MTEQRSSSPAVPARSAPTPAALLAASYQPVVYDNLSTAHRDFVAGPLITGDLLDEALLARAFAEHRIAAVMHFAAASLVGESAADPQKYYMNNVQGTLSLLKAMRSVGCHRSCSPRPARSTAMPTARRSRRILPARQSTPMARRNG